VYPGRTPDVQQIEKDFLTLGAGDWRRRNLLLGDE